ncbi:MAG TPA: TonB-dependent receptor [Chryseolinea sp.]
MTKFYLCVSRYLTVVLVLVTSVAWSQSKTVTGKVTSKEDNSALPGVNVVEKGTSNGTITSVDGDFSITVGSNATLVFSFVGFKAQEVPVGDQSTVNVSIEPDVTALSEVVVIGYGQIEKKDATGALVSLKPSDFNGGVISSPEQLIQGRAAGVQITSASGEPGAGVNIRIRGTSSVRAGNNPLFVIDGVPLAGDDISAGGGASSSGLGMSAARNPLNFLNPNDIASIDVLKDASATAIYGSRGANGVVLITTKSGAGGKGTLDYSYNLSVSSITKKYDLLERDQFLSAWSSYNGGASSAAVDGGANTDWQNEVLRTAVTQQHNLSFGAGDKSSNYRFSVGYMDQQGIVKISGLKRYSARFNGTKSFINDKLKIGTQLTVANTQDSGAPITDNSGFEGDLLGSMLKSNPTLPVRKADGSYNQVSTNEPNPAAILGLTRDKTNTIRALGNISAELEIVKNLKFKTVLGFDKSISQRRQAMSKDLLVSGISGDGRLYASDIDINNNLWENYFTYDKKFSNVSLNAVVGYSYQSFSKATNNSQYTHFRTGDLDQMINNLASIDEQYPDPNKIDGSKPAALGINSSLTKDELQSFFGRVNFGINEKYLFTATLRADGSTKFGPANRYGYFPSAAFKWRAIEEGFVPDMFSDLSARIGYGVTGNQEIPHNLYEGRQRFADWTLNTSNSLGGGGYNYVSFPNPDLKWETTSQINAGIDFGFFNNRITGSLDYYYKNTSDLLIQKPFAQPLPGGDAFLWLNADAHVINRGLEIMLQGNVVANTDFTWTLIANAAFNHNEVQDFSSTIDTGVISGQGLSGAFAQRIAQGQPVFSWFVRDFAGYDENGIAKYNGGDVQKFVGKSAIPKANAGLTNNFKYKKLDLSIFFNGQFGHYLYNNTANAFFTAGALAASRNTTKDVVGNGESRANSPDVSTRFLENGSFVRLQNVTLGYNIPVANTFVSSLRVFVTGQNLFVITDYSGQDPEVNTNKSLNGIPSLNIDYTSYPRARTFTFGVNASF